MEVAGLGLSRRLGEGLTAYCGLVRCIPAWRGRSQMSLDSPASEEYLADLHVARLSLRQRLPSHCRHSLSSGREACGKREVEARSFQVDCFSYAGSTRRSRNGQKRDEGCGGPQDSLAHPCGFSLRTEPFGGIAPAPFSQLRYLLRREATVSSTSARLFRICTRSRRQSVDGATCGL